MGAVFLEGRPRRSEIFRIVLLVARENRSETVLIWRKGAGSPNLQALEQIPTRPRVDRPRGKRTAK